MNETDLRKRFNFDESDLAANRAGRLSNKQEKTLKLSEQNINKYFRRISLALVLIGLFISYMILKSGEPQAYIGVGVVWLVLGVFIVLFMWIANVKIDYTVKSVEGRVNFVKVEKSRRVKSASGSERTETYEVYEMRVGMVNFHNVSEDYLNFIEEGNAYQFHYLPSLGNRIISAEFISKGK